MGGASGNQADDDLAGDWDQPDIQKEPPEEQSDHYSSAPGSSGEEDPEGEVDPETLRKIKKIKELEEIKGDRIPSQQINDLMGLLRSPDEAVRQQAEIELDSILEKLAQESDPSEQMSDLERDLIGPSHSTPKKKEILDQTAKTEDYESVSSSSSSSSQEPEDQAIGPALPRSVSVPSRVELKTPSYKLTITSRGGVSQRHPMSRRTTSLPMGDVEPQQPGAAVKEWLKQVPVPKKAPGAKEQPPVFTKKGREVKKPEVFDPVTEARRQREMRQKITEGNRDIRVDELEDSSPTKGAIPKKSASRAPSTTSGK